MLRFAAGAAALLMAGQCFAQEDAVIITATRFPDSKRDLPVGVTVITAEDIRRSATADLAEILAQYGLVNIRDNTGSPNRQLDLRGFGITGDQNTLVLVDGIRLSDNELSSAQLSSIPLDSIERIEVVRGGGAVLYGGGASGGTINIITRRAKPGETRSYGAARVGGYDSRELRAGVRSMGQGLGFSLDMATESTDGYRRNNEYRQSSVSGTLEAQGDKSRAYLRFGLGRQDAHLPGALTEAQLGADPRQRGTVLATAGRDDSSFTLGGSAAAGRNDWAADLSYRTKDAPARFTGFEVDTKVNQLSFLPRGKLRFDAWGREHDMTVGVDLDRWDLDSRSTFGPRTGEQKDGAAYALANFWLGERTRAVVGGRLQRTEVSLSPDSATHDLSAYELALRHRLGGGWSAYGKLSSSFRVATFDEVCFAACAGPLLKPQTARSGELGTEYEARGQRFRASAYDTRLNNEIYFSPLVFDNINLAPTLRRGLELEASGKATAELDWRAGFAWQQASFRSGTYGGVDVSGKDVPLVPEHMAIAGASWAFDAKRRLHVNGRYVGHQRYDNDQANTFKRMPTYGLVDLKVEQSLGRGFDVALEVRNLFDQTYYSYGITNTFACPTFCAYPQPERAVYLSIAARLD